MQGGILYRISKTPSSQKDDLMTRAELDWAGLGWGATRERMGWTSGDEGGEGRVMEVACWVERHETRVWPGHHQHSLHDS